MAGRRRTKCTSTVRHQISEGGSSIKLVAPAPIMIPPFVLTMAKAWSYNNLHDYEQDRASIIQFCPWFLELMDRFRFQTTGDLGPKGPLALSGSPIANAIYFEGGQKTAMDLINLFDVTMLHELGHTINTASPTVDDEETGGYGKDQTPSIKLIIHNCVFD